MIRPAKPDELPQLAALARASFAEAIAPLLSAEGRAEYQRFASEAAVAERDAAGHAFFACEDGGRLVAMAEVRDDAHLVMLFVAPEHQGRGWGARLLAHVLAAGVETVHASPNARAFYAQAGFEALQAEQEKNGIRFVPMRRARTR